MKIRLYKQSDFPALCEVHDPARKQELHYAKLDDSFIPLELAAKPEGLFTYQVFVAEVQRKIAGFVAFKEHELGWLYVDPKMQKKGVGSALIDYVLGHTERPLYLEVLTGNPAKDLYLHKGFRQLKHASGQMPGNEKFHVEADIMVHW